VADIDGTDHLFAVSCSPGGFCAAADDHGRILTSAAPLSGAGSWTTQTVDRGRWVLSVACPSSGVCVAGDNGYRLISGV